MAELVTWRGTPCVGYFMWALNCCHLHSWRSKNPVNLEMHWSHDEKYLHHFEDPETIIERMQYTHRFYDRQNDVKVFHVLNTTVRYRSWKFDDETILDENGYKVQIVKSRYKPRFWFSSGHFSDARSEKPPQNDWIFREDAFKETINNKIVFWRSTFNAEVPRTWKRLFTNKDWDIIIQKLRSEGFQMVELTYRTPIREAMWHIATCQQIICYDGMWHYMAKNYCKPMLVISDEGVSKYHTEYAIKASHDPNVRNSIWYWINNPETMLRHSEKKAKAFREKIRKIRE